MDRLYVFQYLMDGAGNYILDGDGKTIVNATAEYPVDMAAAGVASYRGRPRRVNSFSILANDDLSDWTLIINQYDLVGRYPSQAVAIGALIGCFIHADADQEGLEFIISDMIQNGTGQIDEDGDNLMSQRISNGTFTGTLRNFNKDLFTGTSNSMQQDKLVVGATVETLLLNDPLQTISVPARYDSSFAFEVRTDKPSPNAIVLPAEVIGPLSNANLGFPVTTPLTGVRYYADFSVDGLDSRIPVTVEYTWLTSSNNGITWIERQSSTTNYYEPADSEAGLRLRCEVEVFYLDSTSTGITSSESTGAIGKIWTWRSGSTGQPLLIESTVGQTLQVSPTFNASFQATGYGEGGGLSFTNDFTLNGTTVQNTTDTFYNYNGTAGTYDCDVTATQTFNGITYTSTSMAAPTFVRASSQDVQFIRLFTALGPSGTDVTDNPPANTSLYAYAYSDLAGTQLITDNVTWSYTEPGDYDSSWMTGEEVLPSARWINADRENASGTYKLGVFAKAIPGIEDVKIYGLKHVQSSDTQDQPEDWTLIGTATQETTATYRGNTVDAYWVDWTVPASAEAYGEIYKFKAEVTSKPYKGHATGSTRTLDGSRSFTPPQTGDATYNDVGLLKSTGWGSYGNIYGTLAPKGARAFQGDGWPFNGEYLHSVVVGRPYTGDIYVSWDTGDDTTATGSDTSPYKTVNKAIEDNETATASYDYILMDGDHRLRDDITISQGVWSVTSTGGLSGGRTFTTMGFHNVQVKAQNTGQARLVGLCDSSYNTTLSATGVQFGDVEFTGIQFIGDDELNGIWHNAGGCRMFASMTLSSMIGQDCSVSNRWDYSSLGQNDLRTPSQQAAMPEAKKGIFLYSMDTQRTGNGLTATVGIGHDYDELIEDAVVSQLGIDITIKKCDNARLPGFYYDSAMYADWAWTNTAGTLSGDLTNRLDYQFNPYTAAEGLWSRVSIAANGVIELHVPEGYGATIVRDFGRWRITANGGNYDIYTKEVDITLGSGSPDIITWPVTHYMNDTFLNLHAALLLEGEGNSAPRNFLRSGTPHPDILQVYTGANDDLGDRVVDNWIASNIDASDSNNVCQGIYLADHNTTTSMYLGDFAVNHLANGTGLNGYGQSMGLINMYWSTAQEGCLIERLSATGGWHRGSTYGSYAKNSVFRNTSFLTYNTESPDMGRDDSATNGKSSIEDFMGRSGMHDDWYGSEAYPLENGYPGLGFMFPNADGPNAQGTTGPGNAYLNAEAPALDPGWTPTDPLSPQIRYEITGGNGVPQKGPADAHWASVALPSGFFTDDSVSGIVYEPNNNVTVTQIPVAFGSPVPSTVTWEYTLDGVGTGVTSAVYSIQVADVGKELAVKYTATDGTGSPDLVYNNVLGTVAEAGGSDWSDAFASGAFVGGWEAIGVEAPTSTKEHTYSMGRPADGNYPTDDFSFDRATGAGALSYNTASRFDLYTTGDSWTYVVGYVEGGGWQKATFTAGQHWNSMPQLTFPGVDFNGPAQVAGIDVMCYALFLTDPGDVSLWTDYVSQAPVSGLRQAIEFKMTTGGAQGVQCNAVTQSNTLYNLTKEIVKSDRTSSQFLSGQGPRLYHGEIVLDYGGTSNNGDQFWGTYAFPDTTTANAFWQNYDGRIKVGNGPWIPMTNPSTPGQIVVGPNVENVTYWNVWQDDAVWDAGDLFPLLAVDDLVYMEIWDSGTMP